MLTARALCFQASMQPAPAEPVPRLCRSSYYPHRRLARLLIRPRWGWFRRVTHVSFNNAHTVEVKPLTFSGIWAIFWFVGALTISFWALKSFVDGFATVGVICVVLAGVFLIVAALLVRYQLRRPPQAR